MTLDTLRHDIDRIDARILALLTERLEKGLLTRRFKSSTHDPERELAVLDSVAARSACLAVPAFTSDVYRLIMAESKAVQDKGLVTIGFQGMHGAYGDIAARSWLPESVPLPCTEFADVFEGVQDGFFDFGIVPVENTLGGTVGQVNSILVGTDLRIVGAVDAPIDHCLMAAPGQDHREIRYVHSHPQALAQCRRFLERNRLDGVPYFDTAGAARMIAEERPRGAAAIASHFASELYGLEIIKEGIQDAPTNRTRFFILAKPTGAGATGTHTEISGKPRTDTPDSTRKCSVVFFTDDKAGALFGTLQLFADASINLTRIESAPYEPGDYAMFLDFEGDADDDTVRSTMDAAALGTRGFRLLGCYPEMRL